MRRSTRVSKHPILFYHHTLLRLRLRQSFLFMFSANCQPHFFCGDNGSRTSNRRFNSSLGGGATPFLMSSPRGDYMGKPFSHTLLRLRLRQSFLFMFSANCQPHFFCGDNGSRTRNLPRARRTLSQLSYIP